jgi:hypothetical protein
MSSFRSIRPSFSEGDDVVTSGNSESLLRTPELRLRIEVGSDKS